MSDTTKLTADTACLVSGAPEAHAPTASSCATAGLGPRSASDAKPRSAKKAGQKKSNKGVTEAELRLPAQCKPGDPAIAGTRLDFSKTRLCPNAPDCNRPTCRYAHSALELRIADPSHRYTRPCRFFPLGKCRNGNLCRFAHVTGPASEAGSSTADAAEHRPVGAQQPKNGRTAGNKGVKQQVPARMDASRDSTSTVSESVCGADHVTEEVAQLARRLALLRSEALAVPIPYTPQAHVAPSSGVHAAEAAEAMHGSCHAYMEAALERDLLTLVTDWDPVSPFDE